MQKIENIIFLAPFLAASNLEFSGDPHRLGCGGLPFVTVPRPASPKALINIDISIQQKSSSLYLTHTCGVPIDTPYSELHQYTYLYLPPPPLLITLLQTQHTRAYLLSFYLLRPFYPDMEYYYQCVCVCVCKAVTRHLSAFGSILHAISTL